MTKKDIVNRTAAETGLPQTIVRQAVQRVFDSIVEALASEGRIELRDFAILEVVQRQARRARNPRTGERVMVPARLRVRFMPGKEMTKKVAEALAWKELPPQGKKVEVFAES